jgi:hypothetical protein
VKRCPFCAEEIRDEAIKCRWCGSMLDGSNRADAGTGWTAGTPGPGGGWTAPPPAEEALQYTHSGQRYLLGYGATSFGIWDRQGSDAALELFPRTDAGWRAAWTRFSGLEPHPVEVGLGPSSVMGAPPAGTMLPTPPPGRGGLAPPQYGSTRPRATSVHPAWWLAPILAGWLGGLIAWIVNRDVDPRVARNMLITGVAISVVSLILIFGVLGGTGRTGF